MKGKHSVEQIVSKLRLADVELGKGLKVPEVCKGPGISEQTYYRWRRKYGGMNPTMARQLRDLEKENARLKKLVADQALDIAILKEAARPRLQYRYALDCEPRAAMSDRGGGAWLLGERPGQ